MSTPNSESSTTSAWAGAPADSRNYFGHSVPLQFGLVVMTLIVLGTSWLMLQLPFAVARIVVSSIPLMLSAYLIYRLYLSLCSVEFFSDRIEIRMPGKVQLVPFAAIRQIRFDSFSHDLLVTDPYGDHRIPRTIQGHRAILHRLHERVEVERDHTPNMEVHVRALPRLGCALSIAAMLALSLVVAGEMPGAGLTLVLFCMPASYMLLDQCILRDYRFTPDTLYVRGLWGEKVYHRKDLKDTWIAKSGLSSRFQMTFSNGNVQFDEYLLSKALIQVSGYVERRWERRVAPLSQRS